MIVFDLIVFFEKSQGYAARGKSARVPGGRGLSDKKRACIVTWRSKGGQAFHSCKKKGMNPRKKLSGGRIRRRRERIRTPSCVPTRTAAKMHHVHRRGRITSRDGAWGILLSHENFRRALRRRKATGKLYQKPGRSVNSSGTAPAEKHGGLAPCVPPPPPSPTKTGKDRATRKAEQGLRRSIPKVPKSTDKASIFEKGADAWGNPARQCPIKEKRHGKRG